MPDATNFNKTRFIELKKKKETLKSQELSLFNENYQEYCELLSYGIILENQIYYNRRAKYIFLVEDYLRENAGEDGAGLFRWEFSTIFRKDNKALKILEKEVLQEGLQRLVTFLIDSKSTELSAMIKDIGSDCEFLTFDPEDTYGINENKFRDFIEKIFFKMQKYFDE